MSIRTEPVGSAACCAVQVALGSQGCRKARQGAQGGPVAARDRVAGPTGFSYARHRTVERLPRC